jgi:hypothetical protein
LPGCWLALVVSRERTRIRVNSSASCHNGVVVDAGKIPDSLRSSSQKAASSISSLWGHKRRTNNRRAKRQNCDVREIARSTFNQYAKIAKESRPKDRK